MSAGLFRIESAGPVDNGGFSGRPAAARLFNSKFIWLSVILVVAAGALKMSSEDATGPAKGQTVSRTNFATTASIGPSPLSDPDPALSASQSSAPAVGPPEAAPVNGLRISSQSWRRGGLGSKALVTFTLRNDNDYAVGDIGLLCAFTRADGSPVTERRPTIRDNRENEKPQDVCPHAYRLHQCQRQPREVHAAVGQPGLKVAQ